MLITGVGSLIHSYSIGYMAHDERRRRFFAYLNLFVAAMLTLVLANNYLILFVGWEGVGLASYLLISFFQHKKSAADAGVKAFVMNRVGDFGMLLAIFTMLAMFGSSKFSVVNAGVPEMPAIWATPVSYTHLDVYKRQEEAPHPRRLGPDEQSYFLGLPPTGEVDARTPVADPQEGKR